MADRELNYWQLRYQEVLVEHRPQKLRRKIQAAEAAIYHRLQAMEHNASVLASAGLGQEFHGAGLDGLMARTDMGMSPVACEEHHGNIRLRTAEFLLEVESTQIGQPYVEH
jgi:hypothetical protein